ncbi:MAG: hypothetical protein AAF664_18925, partial [Planctomycetota bacterium]
MKSLRRRWLRRAITDQRQRVEPILFRRLETRRVLSADFAFSEGVLEIIFDSSDNAEDVQLRIDPSDTSRFEVSGTDVLADPINDELLLADLNQIIIQHDGASNVAYGRFSWEGDFGAAANLQRVDIGASDAPLTGIEFASDLEFDSANAPVVFGRELAFNLPDTANVVTIEDVEPNGREGDMRLLGAFDDTRFGVPSSFIAIAGGNSEDEISITSVDQNFRASLTIDGGNGNDLVNVAADLDLGSTISEGELRLVAEELVISNSIIADGDVVLFAGELTSSGATTGTVTLDASITSRTGSISIQASESILQNAGGDLETEASEETIYVHAVYGSITMSLDATDPMNVDHATSVSNDGDILYQAGEDIAIDVIDAGNGDVGVEAGGSVFDAQDDLIGITPLGFTNANPVRLENILAARAVVVAGDSVGEGVSDGESDPLDLRLVNTSNGPSSPEVGVLAAESGENLYLLATGDVVIGDVTVEVRDLGVAAATQAVVSLTRLGVTSGGATTSNGGHSKVEIIGGDLMVDAEVSVNGDLLLAAGGVDSDVTVNASATSTNGSITILAQDSVEQSADGDLETQAGGETIYVRAVDGSITMDANASSTTTDGNVFYRAESAGQDITIGQIDAGAGDVAVQAGQSIIDAQDDTVGFNTGGFATFTDRTSNIIADEASLIAGTGSIGVAGNPMDLTVNTLAASAGVDAYLFETDGLEIGSVEEIVVERTYLSSSVASVSSGALAGMTATTGHAKVETIDGDLAVNDPIQAGLDIVLAAGGSDSDANIDSSVTSASGSITVLAQDVVVQSADGDLETSTSGETIYVRAVDGSITMDADASSTTTDGNVFYRADSAGQDITIGQLNAGAGDVAVQAARSIIDAQDATVGFNADGFATFSDRFVNIIAGESSLIAGTGSIGVAGSPLDLSVTTLAASAGVDVYLFETDGLEIGSVGEITVEQAHLSSSLASVSAGALVGATATAGHAKIETIDGDLVINDPVQAGLDVVLAAASDVKINDSVISTNGSITVLAQDSVLQTAGGDLETSAGGETIYVRAVDGSIGMDSLASSTTNGGNIYYEADSGGQDVTIGLLGAGSGDVVIRAGQSIIDAQDDMIGSNSNGFATFSERFVNIIADEASLIAGTGSIGVAGDPLDLTVNTLATSAGVDAYLFETDGLAIGSVGEITVEQAYLSSSVASVSAGALAGIAATTGHAKIETIAGGLVVNNPVQSGLDAALAAGGVD